MHGAINWDRFQLALSQSNVSKSDRLAQLEEYFKFLIPDYPYEDHVPRSSLGDWVGALENGIALILISRETSHPVAQLQCQDDTLLLSRDAGAKSDQLFRIPWVEVSS